MNESLNIKERLKEVGINVNDIWDLVNTSESYSQAVPILLQLLEEGVSDIRNREGIIRSLAVKEAKYIAGPLLLKEYDKIPKESQSIRWAIGSTMGVVIGPKDVDGVIKIVLDKTNGKTREMFALALGKVPSEKVENVLISLLNDDQIAAFAVSSLAKIGSIKALPLIKQLTFHPNLLIKRNATKALAKLNKLLE